ncbi:N-acetyl-gamma-glutamyl-phosphate reductase [Rodentibacter myodis]|uniref:N-acetyl-gamma-glutamyl-phosphate reductase n=1 Tax=Rodentibacter myodis TaxID=1907939 RepID=A0A1V3JFN9_9PAST|nr:N-acetyl-gamma-glutamyl-phosphate reductase [Rodentibacter myodis]OOF55423.1 N-acetyl-gamma-glutamyl-phosphate reductase [Rodentibacter myodis]
MKVGIVGITGYSGMVLYTLLTQHPQVSEISLYGSVQESVALSDLIPAFGKNDILVKPLNIETIQDEVDCLFCATPSGVTGKLMQPLVDAAFPVIDLSGDFRLRESQLYENWYHQKGRELPSAEKITYALPEFTTHYSPYIANPGCYATATLLGLAPLAQAGLIEAGSIITDAKSGVSGAGKNSAAHTHFPFINENLWVYRLNQHQHIPEITQQLGEWDKNLQHIQFSTTLLPITRGIMVNTYAKLTRSMTQQKLEAIFGQCYVDKPFVRFRGAQLPTIKEVVGSNFCDIGVVWNSTTQIVTIVSVIDNLMKGAAGQAVQNFNLYFGFKETAGLPLFPIFP